MFQFWIVYQPTFSYGKSGTSQDREQQPPFPRLVCESCSVSQLGADLVATETRSSIDVVVRYSCVQIRPKADMIGLVDIASTAA